MPQAIPIIGAGLVGGLGTAAAGSVAAGALTLGVVGSTALTFSVGSALAATALSALGTGLSMLTAGQADRRRGSAQFVTSRSSIAPQWHILGRARVGGSMVHFESTDIEPTGPQFGDDSQMNYVIPMANHRCRQLRELYLEDQRVAYYPGGDGATVPADSDLVRDTETDYGKRDDIVGYSWRRGDDPSYEFGQVVARGNWRFGDPASPDYDLAKYNNLLHMGEPVWLPSAKGHGIAAVAGLLGWDTQFEVLKGQIPPTTAVWDGDVEVLDPRDGRTKFTRNPALNIRQFLKLSGWRDDELDDVSFAAEANICDEIMTLADGTTEPRYTCDIAFAWDNLRPRDMLRDMLTSCGGKLIYANGTLSLMTAAWRPPSMHFDDGDLRDGFAIRTGQPLQQTFNEVTGTYREPKDLYQPAPYDRRASATYLAQDGEPLAAELDFPCTQSKTIAGRLALIELNRSRMQVNCTIPYTLVALDVGVGDTVAHSSVENGWDEKAFEVTAIKPVFGENTGLLIGFDVSVVETTAAIYDRTAANEDPAVIIRKTTLNVPLGVPGPVSAIMQARQNPDGASVLGIDVSWPPVLRAAVDGYDVAWRDIATGPDGAWDTAPVVDPVHFITPVEAGITYEIKVRARTKGGRLSDYSAPVTVLAAGDTIAPGKPFGLTTAGEFRSIHVRWFNPVDADYESTQIWSHGSDDRDSATRLDTVSGTYLIDSGHDPSTDRWYWARAIDYSGNIGDWNALAGTKGTASALTEHDILEDSIDATQLAESLRTPIERIPALDALVSNQADALIALDAAGVTFTQDIDLLEAARDDILVQTAEIDGRVGALTLGQATLEATGERAADAQTDLDDRLGDLSEALLRGLLTAHESREILTDAEIFRDPTTGVVRLRAIERIAGQVSDVQVNLDATTALIALSAKITYVDDQIAQAVLDPSSLADFTGLTLRMTAVEIGLDGAEAAIALAASQVEVDEQGARLTSAEVDIVGLQGEITLKAEQVAVDAVSARLTTTEVTLASIDGASLSQAVRDVRFAADQSEDAAHTILQGLLTEHDNHVRQVASFAEARNDLTSVVDDVSALATTSQELSAKIAGNTASSVIERRALAEADRAQVERSDVIAAQVDDTTAALAVTAQVVADTETALAETTTSLSADIAASNATITDNAATAASASGANASRLDVVEADLATETGALAQAIGTVEADVTSIGDTVTAATLRLDSITSRVDDAEGDIVRTEQAIVDATGASTLLFTSLKSERQQDDRDREEADHAALTGLVAGHEGHEGQRIALATATEEIETRADERAGVEAAARSVLEASLGDARASVERERIARIDGETVAASERAVLSVENADNAAAVVVEREARVDALGAVATTTDALAVKTDDNAAGLVSLSTTVTTQTDALAQDILTIGIAVEGNTVDIVSDRAATATQFEATATILDGFDIRLDGAEADIDAESTIRAAAVSSLIGAINDVDGASVTATADLQTQMDTVNSAISSVQTTLSTETTALAQDITTVQTAIGDNTASIQTAATSIDALSLEYTVKLDADGFIAGFGLSVEGRTSNFIVRATRFAVGDETGIGYPFIVSGGQTFIKDAVIQNGSIATAKIGVAQIDTLRVAGSAITIFKTAVDYGSYAGTNAWRRIGRTTVYLNVAGEIFATMNTNQGFGVIPATWGLEIRIDGNAVATAEGTYPGDTPGMAGGGSYGAGTHSVEVWSKTSADITTFGSRLNVQVSKR